MRFMTHIACFITSFVGTMVVFGMMVGLAELMRYIMEASPGTPAELTTLGAVMALTSLGVFWVFVQGFLYVGIKERLEWELAYK